MMKFSNTHRYEPDDWRKSEDGVFGSDQNLAHLEKEISKGKFLVCEHWHYRGASCPTRLLIEDFDEFIEYLENNAIAGDIIEVYDLSEVWNVKESIMSGKCPDELGEIPKGGAY